MVSCPHAGLEASGPAPHEPRRAASGARAGTAGGAGAVLARPQHLRTTLNQRKPTSARPPARRLTLGSPRPPDRPSVRPARHASRAPKGVPTGSDKSRLLTRTALTSVWQLSGGRGKSGCLASVASPCQVVVRPVASGRDDRQYRFPARNERSDVPELLMRSKIGQTRQRRDSVGGRAMQGNQVMPSSPPGDLVSRPAQREVDQR